MRLIQRLLSTRGKYVRDTTWDIILKVVTSWANQKIGINKYFNVANYTIDWWDGTTTTATTTNASWAHSKTYASAWTYYITLVNPWSRWKFNDGSYWLVPKSWFTGDGVWIEYMPSLKDWFGDSDTSVWDNFFYGFNYSWALTSLPAWSFDTSNITSVWRDFFRSFNQSWALTSLPSWSFDTSSITSAWNNFFYRFNYSWSIPKVSAWTGVAIKNVSSSSVVFYYAPSNSSDSISAWNTFDWYAKPDIVLKVVTSWASQTIGINKYFNVANYTIDWWDGTTTTATTTNSSWAHSKTYASAWTYYITLVNPWGRWTFTTASYGLVPSSWFTGDSVWVEYMPSLKDWFGDNASNPWGNFFRTFNRDWALTSLPSWSFNTSNITSVWNNFFYNFNRAWALTSLPTWSFNTSNITSVWSSFFYFFNYSWSIPKVSAWTGVSIKNVSSGSVTFHYPWWSDSISAWNTFDWYAKS